MSVHFKRVKDHLNIQNATRVEVLEAGESSTPQPFTPVVRRKKGNADTSLGRIVVKFLGGQDLISQGHSMDYGCPHRAQ